MNDKGAILHAEKQENLLQIDNMILMGMVEHFQSSQNSNFAMYLKYVKKEVRDEDDFLHADINIRMMKHSENTQRNKFTNLCKF